MSLQGSKLNLSEIPYSHRTSAATLLLSKARKLADLADLHFTEFALKDQRKVQQAISFYDMALMLTKRSDPNYLTILNWKCLTLIEIGQYESACDGYKDLVKIAHDNQGQNVRNPTRDFAITQLQEHSEKKNHPMEPFKESEYRILDDPSFCHWCEQFCESLDRNKFTQAHRHFSSSLQSEISIDDLKSKWSALFAPNEGDININLEKYEVAGPDDEQGFIGWCYFTVVGNDTNEAISMNVYQSAGNGFEIGEIDFGRP